MITTSMCTLVMSEFLVSSVMIGMKMMMAGIASTRSPTMMNRQDAGHDDHRDHQWHRGVGRKSAAKHLPVAVHR